RRFCLQGTRHGSRPRSPPRAVMFGRWARHAGAAAGVALPASELGRRRRALRTEGPAAPSPGCLMVGTGEYVTGFVGGKGADSDKSCGVLALVCLDLRSRGKIGAGPGRCFAELRLCLVCRRWEGRAGDQAEPNEHNKTKAARTPTFRSSPDLRGHGAYPPLTRSFVLALGRPPRRCPWRWESA
ncbi:unnamed protein product, partial [Prorocentrum cordatum]